MSKKVIIRKSLMHANAIALNELIIDALGHVPKENIFVMYVKDAEGRTFDSAWLEEETLTDGSKVYNIVLGD